MTEVSDIGLADKCVSTNKATKLQLFFYYLSFVLLYATLTFVSGMYFMAYEDRYGTLEWVNEADASAKIWYITFYILQFPLGLLFGFLTGNYHNGLFAAVLNPLLIGWTLQKIVFKTRSVIIKRVALINYIISTILILTVILYVVTE